MWTDCIQLRSRMPIKILNEVSVDDFSDLNNLKLSSMLPSHHRDLIGNSLKFTEFDDFDVLHKLIH